MTISKTNSEYFVVTEDNQPEFTSVEQMKELQDKHKVIFEMSDYEGGSFNLSRHGWTFSENVNRYRVRSGQQISCEVLNKVLGDPNKNTTVDKSLISVLFNALTKEQKIKVCLSLAEDNKMEALSLFLDKVIL